MYLGGLIKGETMRILILILFLSFTTVASADIFVKGGIKMQTGNVLEPGITIYESPTEPATKNINDEWKNSRTGIISKWDGKKWVEVLSADKITIQDLQKQINSLIVRIEKLEKK